MDKSQELHDPDPWTVISLVVAGVAMVAQLAQLGVQIKQGAAPSKMKPIIRQGFDGLKDQIGTATRNVERLIRALNQLDSSPKPLQSEFRFGATQLLLNRSEIHQYGDFIDSIGRDATSISRWVLMLIEFDPDFAASIGAKILSEMSNVQARINSLYRTAPKNEVVLEEALSMYATFAKIMDRVEREGAN